MYDLIIYSDNGSNQWQQLYEAENIVCGDAYLIQGQSNAAAGAEWYPQFDSNELVRTLSPTNTAERSKFDFASLDSNKLGLFYHQRHTQRKLLLLLEVSKNIFLLPRNNHTQI